MVSAQYAGETALHADLIGTVTLGLIGAVGWIEADETFFTAEIFEGGFTVVDESDDNVSISRVFAAPNEGVITIEYAGLDHRVTGHFEGIMVSWAEER